jgi:hypothetical protein
MVVALSFISLGIFHGGVHGAVELNAHSGLEGLYTNGHGVNKWEREKERESERER